MADSNIITTSNANNAGSYIPSNSQSFNQFYNAFQQALAQSKTWSVLQDSGVGSQLLSNMATLGVACEYFTQRRLQEAFIDTAQSPVSIYEGVFLLGGNIIGNVPANAVVNATNASTTDTLILDKYTTFGINGGIFYTDSQITIAPATTVSFIAVEGKPNLTTVTGTDTANQIFYVSSNYMCNNFVQVQVQATTASPLLNWDKVSNLWLEGSVYTVDAATGNAVNTPLAVYQSAVYPNGQVQVLFGDGSNGQRPLGTIYITAYEASGGLYNITGSQKVTLSTYYGNNSTEQLALLSMVTSTQGVFGGAPKPSADIYKLNASARFATNDRFVTAQDFEAGSLAFQIGNLYPVKACKAVGERDIYPGASALANVVTLVLLMYSADYNDAFMSLFTDYMSQKGVFCIINPILATPVTFESFNMTITVKNASLTQTQIISNIKTALQQLVGAYLNSDSDVINLDGVTNTSLGKRWAISQFYEALIPVIGGNTIVIDYSYNGINTDFTLNYAQYLFINFTENFQINFV